VRRVFSGGKHPDPREHVPLRGGTRGRGSRSAQVRNEGSLQPFVRLRVGDHGMLEQPRRRGTSTYPAMRRSHAWRGGVLRSEWLGPPQLIVIASTCCRRNRSQVRGVARKRRSEERWPSAFHLLVHVASTRREALLELEWLAARSSRKRRATSTPCCLYGGSEESKGKRGDARPEKGRAFRRARIGTLEGRARASLSLVAEVDRRRQAERSVRVPFHPTWGAHGDNSLAHCL